MVTEMGPKAGDDEDDLLLKTFQSYKISFYQETAAAAAEKGDYGRATEMYHSALEEIEEYRDNISEIRSRASLSEEDRKHLAEMEDDLDAIEQGVQEQLETVQ